MQRTTLSKEFPMHARLLRSLAVLVLLSALATGFCAPSLVQAQATTAAIATPFAAQAGTSAPRISPIRPVTTYSIVARDPKTGELGVAVQSHWFSVGTAVPWARAGVGAVATQSMVDLTYGPLGLDMMAAGRSAPASLKALLQADDHPEIRQVAMIDAQGRVAVHTGSGCIAEAGDHAGENYSCQANLMEKNTVPDAMAAAFEAAKGDLSQRMLAALQAAQQEGGDIRGRQSAAMLVVKGTPSGQAWNDIVVDLRVEDAPKPVEELGRLLVLQHGYDMMNQGDLAVEKGDLAAAKRAYGAAQRILGDNLEASYWYAVALCNAGETDSALAMFKEIFEKGENWRTLTPRIVKAGFLKADDELLARIMAQ